MPDPSPRRTAKPKAATLELWLIDAFTDRAFAGNPAAVCLLDRERPDAWMQQLAGEMNQAETAFLLRRDDGFGLRWFTPAVEVDLCGHATLASAHFLWEKKLLTAKAEARFHTRSGLLTATKSGEWIVLDFPATPAEVTEPPPYLLDSLKSHGAEVLFNGTDYLVVLPAASKVRGIKVDFRLLSAIEARGVIVTAPSDMEAVDFISRFFAPQAGVDEDAVTGSAHCTLGPYWGARLGLSEMTGYQASARGGHVKIELTGDRVRLGGKAVTVLKGKLEVGS
jgi:predicted PhzF superfamily epimerase YddE/YHI9